MGDARSSPMDRTGKHCKCSWERCLHGLPVMGPFLPSLGTETATCPLGLLSAIHPAPEQCTPTHFEQKVSAFLFLAVFKCQLHFPVGSHITVAFFHSQPVTPSFPPTLLLNNSDAEKLHFKMLLDYLYPSCITILCIVYFSAFRSFLIHRKQEQDGKVCMKYLFLPGRKHGLLTQALLQTVQTL